MKIIDVFKAVRNIWTANNEAKIEAIYSLFRRVRPRTCNKEKVAIETRMLALLSRLYSKWQSTARCEEKFLKKFSDWLNNDVDFFQNQPIPSQMGRPCVTFESASQKTKLRRTLLLRTQSTGQELVHAAASSLRAEGNRRGAKLLLQAACPSEFSQTVSSNMTASAVKPLTSEDALSFLVECDLSKEQYLQAREMTKKGNAGALLPNYSVVLEAKNACYPPSEYVDVCESYAEVRLQPLLDHTTQRLGKCCRPVLDTLSSDQLSHLMLISKWGLDGSGGHSMYKQKCVDSSMDETHLLVTSFVPLQLYARGANGQRIIVWQNPRPSSPRYCRPIKLQFAKETSQKLKEEVDQIMEQINNLTPSMVTVSGHEAVVTHKMHLTMVDGKVCNAITGNINTQACYICKAKSQQLNDLESVLTMEVDSDALKLGLSSLHAWIRSFEYLLHIAYKLEVRKWQCRSVNDKKIMLSRKTQIQRDFKAKLGLTVDTPKQGFGNTNDGNTARRFFEDPAVTASITKLDQDLIERFSVLLRALASPYEINVEEYEWYATETAYRCVELYPWYTMTPTVHKFLVHGAAIIKTAPLPCGMFAEDAQEILHKNCKNFRVYHTRKASREKCNMDLLHMCLVASDPVVTSARKLPARRASNFPAKVLALLREPSLDLPEFEDSAEEDEE